MSIRDILKMGDPRLNQIAQPVPETLLGSSELLAIIEDMRDTMRAADGAGLAAPQIGIDLQLVLFGSGQKNPRYPDAPAIPQTVLINPVLTPIGTEEADDWEGCLSVPGLRGIVPRWLQLRYQGIDENGDVIDRIVDGFHARVVQHECDHLYGRLYPSRIRDFTHFGFLDALPTYKNATEKTLSDSHAPEGEQ